MENITEVTEDNCNDTQNNGHDKTQDATESSMEEATLGENTEHQRLRSSSVPVGNTAIEAEEEIALHSNAMKSLEAESASNNLIDQALQQEDEFLNYLMSLPAASAPSSLTETHVSQTPTQHAPLLMRSFSSYGDGGTGITGTGSNISSGVAKVGLNHLDNLCKLMEQLGDLREQNSKLQRRVKYLEDLKKLQEMHKQLQEEETKRCETQKTCSFMQSQQNQYPRHFSMKSRQQCRREIEKNFPSPSRTRENIDVSNEHSALAMVDTSNWRSSKCKSMTNSKFNQSSSRYQQRERSKSVGVEELKLDDDQQSNEGKNASSVVVHKEGRTKQVQRRSLTSAVATANKKAKVSKWTKVKEAFKWEKASVVMVSGTNNSQECDINGNCHHMCCKSENMQLLNAPNSFSTASPVGSIISGHSSYSSGGYSPNVPRFHSLKRNYSQDKTDDFIGSTTMASASLLSSSSSSEDLDIEQDTLNFTRPQRSASATDSTHECMVQHVNNRRCSLVHGFQEDETSRRSKSLDGENRFPNKNTSSDPKAQHQPQQQQGQQQLQKAHKTPWGKVKDIIQTRKDSLKKRHQSMKNETYKCDEDQEEKQEQSSTIKASCTTTPSVEHASDETAAKDTGRRARLSLDNTPQQDMKDPPAGRRLTPMLTLTLPSTEELRSLPGTPSPAKFSPTESTSSGVLCGTPNSPQAEERHHKISVSSVDGSTIDKDFKSKSAGNTAKSQIVVRAPPGCGMSPPSHRRASKWTKVKKAFLTGRRDEDGGEGRITNSLPSSPNRNSSFFEEIDAEEANNGELEDQGVQKLKQENNSTPTDAAAEGESHDLTVRSDIHAEIQRNYEELQMKLTQEFHKKLTEWEMVRSGAGSSSSVITYMPTCRGQNLNPASTSLASDVFQRYIDRNEVTKAQRDPIGPKVFDEDNLSPHFRKKLQEWQRMKKAPATGVTAGSLRADDSYAVTPQFRKKIAEWQLWKTGGGKAVNNEQEQSSIPSEELGGKLQQWENMKASSSGHAVSSATNAESLSSIKSDISEVISADESNSNNAKTSSPKINQKDGLQNAKMCQSVTNKIGEFNAGDDGGSNEVTTIEVKNYNKGKSQKYKELHWLEKELQKIEREKQRLEREREKYLEREARLEKMRLAVGAGRQKQEVLIQTSTGFFRFQGISEKFTRRLYEWEKARGIGPEASTFALLDPGYRPALIDSSLKQYGKGYGGEKTGEGSTLARSKSAGSVSNLGNTDIISMTGGNAVAAIITHQSSSLSLNDVEVLEKVDITSALEDSRAASEPHICISEDNVQDDEPAAMIVDVEDVVVETAAPLPASPVVSSQTPIYSYAPEEVSQLIDSSGSDEEYNDSRTSWKGDSKKEYNYNLLEENINLLEKLKMKEDICKKLENEIEGLEGKIEDVAKIHELELQHLEEEEKHLCTQHEAKGEKEHEELVKELRVHIRNLEHRQECLRQEEEQLQDSFIHHSEQQATLAHSLVNKVKQLQEANMKATSEQTDTKSWNRYMRKQGSTVNLVQKLSTQLIEMAEKLEIVLAQRNTEIQNLKLQLRDQGYHSQQDKSRYHQHWCSEEEVSTSKHLWSRSQGDSVETQSSRLSLPRQSSDELIELPSLLTNKVLELKELLNMLCVPQDTNLEQSQDDLKDSREEGSDMKNATNSPSLHHEENESPSYDPLDFEENTKSENVPDSWHERKQRRQHTSSHLSSATENHNEGHNDHQFKFPYKPQQQNRETENKQLPYETKQQKENNAAFSFSKSVIPSSENVELHNIVDSSAKKAEVETFGVCHEGTLFISVDRNAVQRKEDEANIESCSKSKSNTIAYMFYESDVEEESSDESDKTDEEEDDEDEDEDDECYNNEIAGKAEKTESDEPRSIQRSHLTNIKAYIHATENKSESTNVTKAQFLSNLHEDRRKDYETEVHSTNRNERKSLNERHKSLKTRRISDTHIGYKHQKYDQYDKPKYSTEENNAIAQLGSNIENNQTEHSKPTRNNLSNPRSTSCTAVNVAGTAKIKISDTNIQTSVVKSSVQAINEAVELTSPLPSTLRKTTRRSSERERGPAISTVKGSSLESLSSATVHDNSQIHLKESVSATPDNVFVKTTRKIFSPVRRDSKGKPSSVISYTVGESPPRTRASEDLILRDNSSAATKEAAKFSSSRGSGNLFTASDKNETINNESVAAITTPSWVIIRNGRSQSSSPALMRRKILPVSSAKIPADEQRTENVYGDQRDITKSGKQKYVDRSNRSSQERKISKGGSSEENSNSCQTPPPSFPPIPQSPGPTRRDLLKVVNKETAPSIRMMIAKYNQKLTDGRYGNGARGPSPEVNAGASSGSASPVAWRSPVAERRVLAQMERYQEEVRRVLTKGSNKLSEQNENNRVKKSASAGLISVTQDNLSKPFTEPKTISRTNKPTNTNSESSSMVDHQQKGILKSSSAGAIKPKFSPLTTLELKSRGQIDPHNKDAGVPLPDHTSTNLKEQPPAKKKPPVYNTSLSLDMRCNPEGEKDNESNIFCHNDLPIQPRALKLQRAKQEFLTRGPSEASKLWSNYSEIFTDSTAQPENTSKAETNVNAKLQDKTEKHQQSNTTYNRLSFISVDSDILVPVGSANLGKNLHSTEEGLLLVKSASAGMINVDQGTYNQMCGIGADSHSSGTSDGPVTKTKIAQGGSSKFGISSIASKFRKVKMRKSKEATGTGNATNKMNTVTMLCRQSLLVDLHLSKGNNESTSKETDISKPSTSKSCPSSPVLQRPPSGGGTVTENRRVNIATTSWICNPARKIFKPK